MGGVVMLLVGVVVLVMLEGQEGVEVVWEE